MTWRLILVLLFASLPAGAVCHVVTPAGGGSFDGSTWTNAFAGLPATLVRGDTYFIGSGTYTGGYIFNTAVSGTTLITIKKAISTDHCTDTGYSDATMGVGQAVWTTTGVSGSQIWRFTDNGSSYWVIDGQRRTNLKSGHGFKIDNSVNTLNAGSQTYVIQACGFGPGVGNPSIQNVTIRFVEIAGGGVGNSGDSYSISAISRASNVVTLTTSTSHRFLAASSTVVGSQIAVSGVADSSFNTTNSRVTAATATTVSYSNSGADGSSSGGTLSGAITTSEFDVRFCGRVDTFTFERSYIHDTSDTPLQNDGQASNLIFQYNDIARNHSNGLRHSEGYADQSSNRSDSIDSNGKIIFRYNVFEDLEGTGYIVTVGTGPSKNLEVYGNVFMWHQNNPYRRSGLGNGVVTTTSNSVVTGTWLIHNNSFIALTNGSMVSTANAGAGSNATITSNNNMFYSDSGVTGSYPSGANQSNNTHNWTYCSTTGSCPSETNLQTASGTPFVDWINENYHLSAATNPGNTLASPYNTDPDGLTRGTDGVWDRGAFEFNSSSCSPVISSVTLNPTSVAGGTNSTGTATISCAPSVDTAVSLSSSNTAVATVPATVTVLANQTTANFTVTTSAVCVSTNVTITATLGGNTTAALTVTVGAAPCAGANIIGIAKALGTAIIQ